MLRLLPDKFVFIRLIHQVGIFVGLLVSVSPTELLSWHPHHYVGIHIYTVDVDLCGVAEWRILLQHTISIYICTYLLLNPSLLAFEVDVVVGSFCSFAPRVGRCAPLIKSLGNEWICFVLITVVFSPFRKPHTHPVFPALLARGVH